MFLPLKGSLEIFFGHYSMIQISVHKKGKHTSLKLYDPFDIWG